MCTFIEMKNDGQICHTGCQFDAILFQIGNCPFCVDYLKRLSCLRRHEVGKSANRIPDFDSGHQDFS